MQYHVVASDYGFDLIWIRNVEDWILLEHEVWAAVGGPFSCTSQAPVMPVRMHERECMASTRTFELV